MIATENEHGDLDLRITTALFDLVADFLGNDDRSTICFTLERLPLRTVVRLERLAAEDPEFASDFLKRTLEC